MYHITKTKSKEKPFSIVNLSENGELLSSHPLKTKQACFKNVMAAVDEIRLGGDLFNVEVLVYAIVQDDTVTPHKVWAVDKSQYSEMKDYKPAPTYIPGKNHTKKKKSAKK